MGIIDLTQNDLEFEETDFQCSLSYDEESGSSPDSIYKFEFPTVPVSMCYGCSGVIEDQFILRVNEQTWHQTCLRCSYCHTILDNHGSCFVKDGNIYCRKEEFGMSCSRCHVTIQKDDWIRKAYGNCYHIDCFNCDICKRQLPTGEPFALHNNRLLCKIHYLQVLNLGKLGKERIGTRKAKRMRTTFNDEQVQIFQSFFNVEQNPDPQDLDTMAHQAGVCHRVAQVWFQNARARSKKNTKTSYLSPMSVSSKDSYSSEHSFDCLEGLVYSD